MAKKNLHLQSHYITRLINSTHSATCFRLTVLPLHISRGKKNRVNPNSRGNYKTISNNYPSMASLKWATSLDLGVVSIVIFTRYHPCHPLLLLCVALCALVTSPQLNTDRSLWQYLSAARRLTKGYYIIPLIPAICDPSRILTRESCQSQTGVDSQLHCPVNPLHPIWPDRPLISSTS